MKEDIKKILQRHSMFQEQSNGFRLWSLHKDKWDDVSKDIENIACQKVNSVSGCLHISDAREQAKNVYARMTSYANYAQMNGIESSWFIECIAQELVKVSISCIS